MRAALGLALVAVALAFAHAGRAADTDFTAMFAAPSYAAGATAELRIAGAPPGPLTLQVFRVGPEPYPTTSDEVLNGVAVDDPMPVDGGVVRVALHAWPSGLYYARVAATGGAMRFAPFVLRPATLGTSRVLVVEPTYTWEAYNKRDGDSWYANPAVTTTDLSRPYLDRGVPPHFRGYDLGFLRWLARMQLPADVIADQDLDALMSAKRLRDDYDLIVFPGHEEYVTQHMYDLVGSFRDRGGNLIFLSADDFYRRVRVQGRSMTLIGLWRDEARPESSLVGAEYIGWDERVYRNRPFTVSAASSWIFAGTGLHAGSHFGVYGIEADATDAGSPRPTLVLARIPGIFGPGRDAEMTFYRAKSGAQVFSAGVMNFGGSALQPDPSRILANLWQRLAGPTFPPA